MRHNVGKYLLCKIDSILWEQQLNVGHGKLAKATEKVMEFYKLKRVVWVTLCEMKESFSCWLVVK